MIPARTGRTVALYVLCALLALHLPAAGAGRSGCRAVQFGIEPNFTLGSFDGALFGYQWYTGEDTAWRVTVGLGLSYEEEELETEGVVGDTVEPVFDTVDWDRSVTVVFERLWYRGEELSFYCGGGPRFGYSDGQSEGVTVYPDWQWRLKNTGHQLRAGVQGSAGVQWLPADWLSVHAEYNATCLYVREVNEYESLTTGVVNSHEKERQTTSRVWFDSAGVRLGMSVYF